jgi:urease accessory protein
MKHLPKIIPLILFGLSTPAFAHPGHGVESGLVTGLLHPLTGADHMLAMLMVGLFAGLAFPKQTWMAPTAFVAFMLVGFGFGANGGHLPIAEILILASLVCLGLALVFELKPPLAVAVPAIALFAIGHGFAHGSEMASGENGLTFALGFVASTIALHCIGIALSGIALRPQFRQIGKIVGVTDAVVAVAAGLTL